MCSQKRGPGYVLLQGACCDELPSLHIRPSVSKHPPHLPATVFGRVGSLQPRRRLFLDRHTELECSRPSLLSATGNFCLGSVSSLGYGPSPALLSLSLSLSLLPSYKVIPFFLYRRLLDRVWMARSICGQGGATRRHLRPIILLLRHYIFKPVSLPTQAPTQWARSFIVAVSLTHSPSLPTFQFNRRDLCVTESRGMPVPFPTHNWTRLLYGTVQRDYQKTFIIHPPAGGVRTSWSTSTMTTMINSHTSFVSSSSEIFPSPFKIPHWPLTLIYSPVWQPKETIFTSIYPYRPHLWIKTFSNVYFQRVEVPCWNINVICLLKWLTIRKDSSEKTLW